MQTVAKQDNPPNIVTYAVLYIVVKQGPTQLIALVSEPPGLWSTPLIYGNLSKRSKLLQNLEHDQHLMILAHCQQFQNISIYWSPEIFELNRLSPNLPCMWWREKAWLLILLKNSQHWCLHLIEDSISALYQAQECIRDKHCTLLQHAWWAE